MKPLLKVTVFFLWSLLILAGYYYFHKPLTPQQFLEILGALVNLAGSLLILALCGGLGYKIARFSGSHPLNAFSVQAALGAGSFSLLWLALGLAGLYRWWAALVVLLAGLVYLRDEIFAWARQLGGILSVWQDSGTLGRIFLLASLLLALNQTWIALAPPVKYDALTYHLALPAAYAAQGGLAFFPTNPYWGHPQLAEMLFTWIAALGGQPASGAIFNWWCGLVMFAGLAGFTFEHFPGSTATARSRARAAAAAVFFVLAGATARWMLGWAYTDLISAWMGLGVLASLLKWHETGQPTYLGLAGVFTGLAAGTKYTAAIIAIGLYLGIWLVRSIRKPTVRLWLASGVISLLIFAPWALKNLAYTGNPLFPYAIPTPAYDAQRLADANLPSADYQVLPQIVLPIYLTWTGVDSAPGPSTDLGPLLILFALPALVIQRRSPTVQFLGVSLLVGWLAMSVGGARFGHLNQPRLFFVLLPALAALAGWGWAELQNITAAGVRLNRLTAVLAFLILGLVLLQDGTHLLETGAINTVIGLQSSHKYLEDNTGVYITAMDRLSTLPKESKVLMLWEARGLYAPPNTLPDPWIDAWRASIHRLKTPQAVLDDLRGQGISHLLVYTAGMEYMRENDAAMTPEDWDALDQFLALLPAPTQAANDYYLLYEISGR